MADFFKSIQDKVTADNEEAARQAALENEERRRKEEEMASALSKMNQDEMVHKDEIMKVSESGIVTKPIFREQEPLSEVVKDAMKEHATKIIDKAKSSMTVLKKPQDIKSLPVPPPPVEPEPKPTPDAEEMAERYSQYWD